MNWVYDVTNDRFIECIYCTKLAMWTCTVEPSLPGEHAPLNQQSANMPRQKKQRSYSSSDVDVDDIGNSTSSFGKKAEKLLKIHIEDTNSFNDIVGGECGEDDVNQELKDLYLEEFDRDAVRVYKPQQHKNLTKNAQTFLYKLGTVVNNNYVQVEPPRVEEYIHDLMDNVLKEAKFEEGTDLILMPCLLRLYIGEEDFAAYSDKEGRRGTEIVWVLDEDKHKFDKRYKKGDIQLVANMIAAVQTNVSVLEKVYPRRMLGIKFDADCLYFYSVCITQEYLDDLASEGRPNSMLTVKKFPKDRELSLSVPIERKEIFLYLSALRKYALSLKPFYIA